ncbi:hypothetical protein NDU88_008849 [Pleurodeles waltl]|uniref:Uncharacterized protein n=1 Tax=Pleurodeles waltl TaxID=8319 RepID=A0AAV7PQC2_PLEWA|nr:hypothetical protein NDU88_008849 [Pleurodeles waltl]
MPSRPRNTGLRQSGPVPKPCRAPQVPGCYAAPRSGPSLPVQAQSPPAGPTCGPRPIRCVTQIPTDPAHCATVPQEALGEQQHPPQADQGGHHPTSTIGSQGTYPARLTATGAPHAQSATASTLTTSSPLGTEAGQHTGWGLPGLRCRPKFIHPYWAKQQHLSPDEGGQAVMSVLRSLASSL